MNALLLFFKKKEQYVLERAINGPQDHPHEIKRMRYWSDAFTWFPAVNMLIIKVTSQMI